MLFGAKLAPKCLVCQRKVRNFSVFDKVYLKPFVEFLLYEDPFI